MNTVNSTGLVIVFVHVDLCEILKLYLFICIYFILSFLFIYKTFFIFLPFYRMTLC